MQYDWSNRLLLCRMKKIFLFSLITFISIACLLSPVTTPDVNPVETVVVAELTYQASHDKPTEAPILPPLPSLPPPAVGIPTRMATPTDAPTLTPFTIAPLPTSTPTPLKVTEKSIKYSITGSATSIEVTYVKPDGTVENKVITPPFEVTMIFKVGSPLSLFGKVIGDYGSVACKVESPEKTIIEARAQGLNEIAFCSDKNVE